MVTESVENQQNVISSTPDAERFSLVLRWCEGGVTWDPAMKRVSESVRVAGDLSSLDVALRYWPGRWHPSTIVAAMAVEPFAGEPVSAHEWPAVLDDLERALWGVGERRRGRKRLRSV